MHKKVFFRFWGGVIFLFAFVWGCQSPTVQKEDVVLERSEKTVPLWVSKSALEEESSQKEYIYLVFKKNKVYNISLGIKQAEISALYHVHDLLKDRIRQDFSNYVKYPYDKSQWHALLEPLLNDSMSNVPLSQALPRAVYWEHRQSYAPNDVQNDALGSEDTNYVVWVLLSLQKTEYKALVKHIAQKLISFDNEEAASIGRSILNAQ